MKKMTRDLMKHLRGAQQAHALGDVMACAHSTHHSLQALLALLTGCPGDHPVTADQLLALLHPLADQAQQVLHGVEVALNLLPQPDAG